MVRCCSVYKCKNKQNSLTDQGQKVSFHKFPNLLKSPNLYEEWLNELRRKNFTPSKDTFICSAHFLPDDFELTNEIKLNLIPGFKSRPYLKETAVPSINMTGPTGVTPPKRNYKYIEIKDKRPLLSDIHETPIASGSGCVRKRSTATGPQLIDRESDLIDDASRIDMTEHSVSIPDCSLTIEMDVQCELGYETFRSCNDLYMDMSHQESKNDEVTHCDSHSDSVSGNGHKNVREKVFPS